MEVVAVEGKDVASWRDFRNELRTSPKIDDPRKAGDKVKITFRSVGKDKKETSLDATLALEMMEFTGGFGGRGQPNRQRPFLMDSTVGGQQANVQNDQGKDGVNTGGIYRVQGQRRNLDPRQQPQPAAVLLLEHPRRSERRQGRSTSSAIRPSGRAPTAASASPPPTPAASTRTTTPLWINPKDSRHMHHRLRRRLLRHLRQGRDVGPPQHPRPRPVLPRRGGQQAALQRLRRPAGQRLVGRPVAHAARHGARQRRLDVPERRRRLRLPRRFRSIPISSTPRARAGRSIAATSAPANRASSARSPSSRANRSASTGTRRSSCRTTTRASSTRARSTSSARSTAATTRSRSAPT